MPQKKERIWLLITVVVAVLLARYALTWMALKPWYAMSMLAGDSAKNIFAYLYQSMYGHGFHFEGMNYPYGDNIVYADGQATWSVVLSLFVHPGIGLGLTIMWWGIALSYILSIVYLFKILAHFKVPLPLATVFACLIGIFAPQVFRISAHFGLSYTCVIPMAFYWTIRYHERARWKYCVYLFLLGVIATFLHPYFSGMLLVWICAYALGYFIFSREKLKQKVRHILPVLCSMVVMLGVVFLVIKVTDPIKDRPATPYGLLHFTSKPEDIYTSSRSPVWLYISDHSLFSRLYSRISNSDEGEGYTYIGLTAIIVVLYSLLVGIYSIVAKDKERVIVGRDGFSPIWLFMAIVAILFGMGVPYMWHTDWVLEHLSFMKQFRSLGRFSWIFYYIITIYAAVVIGRRFISLRGSGRTFDAYAVLLLCIGLWSFEAKGNMERTRELTQPAQYNYEMYFNGGAEGNWTNFLNKHGHTAKDFQAMIMLPYFHVGSDKLWVGETGINVAPATRASLELHLPMVNSLMARTSWSQTKKQVKIAAGPYTEKPAFADLRSDKPFLLLKYNGLPLDPDQEYLLQAADYIGHFSDCEVYCFYPARQLANDRSNAGNINTILPFVTTADTCVQYAGEWAVYHFDNAHAASQFFGTGAAPCIKGHDSVVAEIAVRPMNDSQQYELSAWFLLGDQDPDAPYMIVQQLDSMGNEVSNNNLFVKCSTDNEGMWFRGALYFRMLKSCRTVRCKMISEVIHSYITMDELLLRPANALIISKSPDGSVLVNNHLFKKGGGVK